MWLNDKLVILTHQLEQDDNFYTFIFVPVLFLYQIKTQQHNKTHITLIQQGNNNIN